MKFMVIETFKDGKADQVYDRFRSRGRMLPDGLYYINSWLTVDRDRCYQLMSTENPELFDQWIANWSDLTDFEVIELID